jgi:hypothetical protein
MLAALLLAAAAPQTVLVVPPEHRLVEGVASDGRTIYVSSVLDRQILACQSTCRVFTELPAGLNPMGMAWDPARKRLWVAVDCPALPGVAKCERGTLLELDASGKALRHFAPAQGPFHPGDVAVGKAAVFVSDSMNGAVYRLRAGKNAFDTVIAPGVGKSAQGSVLDPTGKKLIVADYALGIAAINLAKGARTLLPRQDSKPLRGIDGVVRCGATYIGIYNAITPAPLITFHMRPGGIEYGELIEGLQLPDPTQIAFDGKRLLVVADSGWKGVGEPGSTRKTGATIVAIPLGADCKPL